MFDSDSFKCAVDKKNEYEQSNEELEQNKNKKKNKNQKKNKGIPCTLRAKFVESYRCLYWHGLLVWKGKQSFRQGKLGMIILPWRYHPPQVLVYMNMSQRTFNNGKKRGKSIERNERWRESTCSIKWRYKYIQKQKKVGLRE